jgi:plastocyanin
MLIHLLGAFLALTSPPSLPTTGTVSGRVVLLRSGRPAADASNAAVWIEGLRRSSGDAPGTVRGEMKSERKRFAPRVVVVPRRDVVEFPNVDPIYHNVFSVSGENRFDLGLYRSGASRRHRFDEPGLVRVYCNIHPTMVGFVQVVDSDYTAVTGAEGAFRFESVPPGTYQVRAWHEEAGETTAALHVRAGENASVELTLDASGFRPQPHKNKYGKDYPPPPPDDERY